MNNKKIKITKVKCSRCGHEWVPRIAEPRTCAGCNSPYWNVPKKNTTN